MSHLCSSRALPQRTVWRYIEAPGTRFHEYLRDDMYPEYFGFEKLPFRLRPDPDFLYAGHEYLRARTQLLVDLRATSRIILLSGAPGVGKTTLLEDVVRELAGHFVVCTINQPRISPVELTQALLLQVGVGQQTGEAEPAPSFGDLLGALDSVARKDTAPLLIVDDAQLLAGGTLRAFRAILARAPRMKILLALQTRSQQRGDDIATRIGIQELPRDVQLRTLSAEAAKFYVERRLAAAGCSRQDLFTADAHAVIHQQSGGNPRLVNVLCDAALTAACVRSCGHVSAAEVLLATEDPRWPEAVARDRAPGDPKVEVLAHAPAELQVSHGTLHVGTWELKPGRLAIGRAADNELQIQARYISRHHCQVITVGEVSTIEDLGSVNGLCVNGRTVKQHILQPGDEVLLGEHRLTYRAG